MNEKVEIITYLDGLKSEYDEFYSCISNQHPFTEDLLEKYKFTFNLFQPERLSEMGSKE